MGSNNNGSDFALTVQSTGNVGIGFTSPTNRLSVNGSIYSTASNGNSLLCLSSSSSSTTSIAIGRTAAEGRLSICAANSQWFGNTVPGDLALRTESTSQKIHIGVNGSGIPDLTISNGKIGINNTSPTYPLQVGTTTSNGNGAYVTIGGTWTNGSSRTFKDRFIALNASDVINKIIGIEVKGWYYKETNEYHIGPVAEDFYTAFGTGDKNSTNVNKYLSPSDVAGVTMIAIKELIKENESQKQKIEIQQTEIDELKAEIESIKTLLKK